MWRRSKRLSVAAASAAVLVAVVGATDPWYKAHYDALTAGLTSLDGGGQANSDVQVFGEKAFAVAVTASGHPVIAAAEFGKGRVVAAGRKNWIFDQTTGSMGTFAANALKWLANGKASPRIASSGAQAPLGVAGAKTWVPATELAKGGVDIYCVAAADSVTLSEAAAIVDFVKAGGSLLAAGHAWASDAKPYFTKFFGNRYLTSFGLAVGESHTLKAPSPVSPMPGPNYNLLEAVKTLHKDKDTKNARARKTMEIAIGGILSAESMASGNAGVKAVYEAALATVKSCGRKDRSTWWVLSKLYEPVVKMGLVSANPADLNTFKFITYDVPGWVSDSAARVTKTPPLPSSSFSVTTAKKEESPAELVDVSWDGSRCTFKKVFFDINKSCNLQLVQAL